jgi:hypothetical protein
MDEVQKTAILYEYEGCGRWDCNQSEKFEDVKIKVH